MANNITTVVEYQVTQAIKNLQDTQKELGKTEISGKDLASALRRAADNAEKEMESISGASAAMEKALGADFVEARRQAGVSVDDIVLELSHLGVSFKDIETDADQLADAVKRLDDVRTPIKGVGDEAKTASEKLDKVRDSGDQSRSVLANLVGNSAQDLGELGGVAGTAGVAIGQLAEYATDGNISVSSLAKLAGPMVGVGVAVAGVSWAMGKLKEESERAKKEAERMLRVQEQLRDGKFEEAGELLAESYGDLARQLDAMGVPQQEVLDFIVGASDSMPTFNQLLDENKIAFAEGGVGLTDFGGKLNDLAGGVYDARDAFVEQEKKLVATDQAAQMFTDTLIKTARETGDTEAATRDLEAAFKSLNDELSDDEAWLDLQDKLVQYAEDMRDASMSNNDKRRSIIELKQELISYLGELEGVPAEKQTEILALIDQGKFDEAEAALAALTRQRVVPISPTTGGQLPNVSTGRDGRKAMGGPVRAGGEYLVGENGPEILQMGSQGGNIVPNHALGGSMNVVINMPAGSNGDDVVRAIKKYEQRNGKGWRQ